MIRHGWPILSAILLWWFTTGAILWLDRFRDRARGAVMVGATVVFAGALAALHLAAQDTSVTGAHIGFVAALMVWGWNEIAFLTGFLAGSSRAPCPVGSTGWSRFGRGVGAVAHHELALALSGLAVAAVSIGAENKVGLAAFGILWAMRVSAKLNLFLGVPHAPHDMLPPHLAYLGSFFRQRPMNLLFPVSITAATALCLLLASRALDPAATDAAAASATLLAALAVLGLVEHWFLVFPVRAETLWGWGLASRTAENAVAVPVCPDAPRTPAPAALRDPVVPPLRRPAA